ncbi:MAG: AAA family ATPase [Lewinellaceae bacterium]|nr:AAA family ATPase [Lewinellaceae bacterium]
METTDTPTYSVDKQRIRERKDTLERVKAQLKRDFVGIDTVIDSLLDYIQIWYLMPEILSRPIIVCLWGMTGVGKTDLVRRMIKYLEIQDRFTEMELGNNDDTSYIKNVSTVLTQEGFDDGRPAVILFDEIQRFNTVEPDGSPVSKTQFTDFWQLLSDGRLPKRDKDDVEDYVTNYLFSQRKKQRNKGKKEEEKDDYYSHEIGVWEARNLKKLLGLDKEVVDIAEMNHYQVMALVTEAKSHKTMYEPVDYSKLLIIISGNLDEAFHMATQTAESDIDADIFHAFTRKITQVDIKYALTKRFRPEQVARFGNIHLIYASLRRADFKRLIALEINKIVVKTRDRFGVHLEVRPNMHRLIYRNGVFPVQGVRPVFSSIVDILETNLSKFLFEALLEDVKKIILDYDDQSEAIVAVFEGQREIRLPFVGRMDKIRESAKPDAVLNVSVHEAGHAVAYIMLFGLAPLQLKSKLANSYAEGFTFPHEIYATKENLVKKIMVYLAGGLAEEVLFGPENATIGRAHDREQATRLVMDYIRGYGFDDNYQANYLLQEEEYAMDRNVTDAAIEGMMTELVGRTRQILRTNQDFLLDLTNGLATAGSLGPTEVAEIAAQHGLQAIVREEGYLHLPPYSEILRK